VLGIVLSPNVEQWQSHIHFFKKFIF
jgi:hypothetical protein